jgi:hypothetical protein
VGVQAGGDVVDDGEQAVGVGALGCVGGAGDLVEQGGGGAAVGGVVAVLGGQVGAYLLLDSGAAGRDGAEAFALFTELAADRRGDQAAGDGRAAGQRLQRQVCALMGEVLDLGCRVVEQLVSQIGQCARGGDLLSDLRDLLVIGVPTGQAVADQANGPPGQSGLGPRLPACLEE